MKTNVKATNWPTRAEARHTMPRESRKGERVASARTYEARRMAALKGKMDQILAHAERFARGAAARHAGEIRDAAIEAHANEVADAAEQKRIATHSTREACEQPTMFVGDGLRYFKR